jgi:hypothetical protein
MTEMTEDWFIAHQARAWEEIREWAQEAEAHPMIPTKEGGSWDGPGASLENTRELIQWLPEMWKKLEVVTVLDAACGDWNWMQHVDLTGIYYTGWDVDPGRIQKCKERMIAGHFVGEPTNISFNTVNLLTAEAIPQYDMILCRDCLGHFTNGYISRVLRRFRDSASRYLMASTYPHTENQFEYDPRRWAWLGYLERPVNLEAPPWQLHKLDALAEPDGPGGVLTIPHELGLFKLKNGNGS